MTMHTNDNGFGAITALMKRLLAPGGCPWDREQTAASLTPYLLEECHELLEALASGDRAHICEECGDLLFQIVFLSELFAEEGAFTIDDVLKQLHAKMVRRHPHVFGEAIARDADTVVRNWEEIKAGEKKQAARASVLDGVPKTLPALSRALAIQKKAARVGFDWECGEAVLDKAQEELEEMREAEKSREHTKMRDEFGDLLLALVNYARKKELDPELALGGTIQKFVRRFGYIEQSLRAGGKNPDDSNLEEMDALWNEAKKVEKR